MTTLTELIAAVERAPAIEWMPGPGIVGAFRVGHSNPPHPADGMTAHVEMGGGAVMTMVNPQSFEHGGIEWCLRYGSADAVRYSAASVISSYDYLLSSAISMTDATRRLRHLRRARAAMEAR